MELLCLSVFLWCLLDHGSSDVDPERASVSVLEGDSVTLHTGVQTNQQDIKWYFNDIRIAQINGDLSKICTDVQFKGGDERFTGRLKLDHQSGSLTIMNITNTDSGEYKLYISSSNNSEKIFIVSVTGLYGVDTDGVSVMEGDSVTLHTDVQTNQQDEIIWYYNVIRIAEINRDQSKICTDVQCNKGTERFRDRLKLDHQTGSLTIINITDTHSGEYTLQISRADSNSDKIFIVSVTGVSAADRDEAKRKTAKQGELVTLDPGVVKNPKDLMMWYFNGILIAEISDKPSKTCADDQCKERFGDRLKLDHQTGSLNITHTTNTHSGEYKLQISNSRVSVTKIFSVYVTAVPDPGLSSADIGGICAAAAVILLAAAGIYCLCRSKQKGNRLSQNDLEVQENAVPEQVPLNQKTKTARVNDGNGTCHNETETALMAIANGTSFSVTRTNGISQ